ncbi:cupin domain-containing protein [Bifidobacterium pullorum subsp. saeculare]|uniref:Cupin domain-containing protein n=1 Tax=Bifidobacterium pullorum subsp. saeculare TaxID=78257 RepID=A0A939B8C3_9BIFI|nr:cupin domain-containing protein [Bifidobacterium pullorum]MBM6699767.1 cupin domain-containing protein [Bifidobacterium pullorum subsp. saeculare]
MSVALEEMSGYARGIVARLGMEAHPEGGWYVRDWQSPLAYRTDNPDGGLDGRPLASLIYFLLPQGDASAWHKVDADEIWLWHGPAPVTLQLGGDGERPDEAGATTIRLGAGLAVPDGPEPAASDAAGDGAPVAGHAVVPAGLWQRTVPGTGDALVSCVVSPGFTFDGFVLDR